LCRHVKGCLYLIAAAPRDAYRDQADGWLGDVSALALLEIAVQLFQISSEGHIGAAGFRVHVPP